VLKRGGGCWFLSFVALLRIFFQTFISYCKFIMSKALKWGMICPDTLIFSKIFIKRFKNSIILSRPNRFSVRPSYLSSLGGGGQMLTWAKKSKEKNCIFVLLYWLEKKNRCVGFQNIWCNIQGGYKEMLTFADKMGRVKKATKTCWHNIWMVPRQEKQFVRSLRWSWRVH